MGIFDNYLNSLPYRGDGCRVVGTHSRDDWPDEDYCARADDEKATLVFDFEKGETRIQVEDLAETVIVAGPMQQVPYKNKRDGVPVRVTVSPDGSVSVRDSVGEVIEFQVVGEKTVRYEGEDHTGERAVLFRFWV